MCLIPVCFQCIKTSDNIFHEGEDLEVDEQSFGSNLNHLDEDSDWCSNSRVVPFLQNVCVHIFLELFLSSNMNYFPQYD